MDSVLERPFESIESAQDFVGLLAETVTEAKQELEADVEHEAVPNLSRRLDVLRMTRYNLEKLEFHVNQTRRILHDLRVLQQLLCKEQVASAA